MTETRITDFQVMFALHTGVTIMTPKVSDFDACEKEDPLFTITDNDKKDIVVLTPDNKSIILADVKDDYISEARERGFIMVYELDDEDEIIRCTPCQLKR